MQCMMNLTLYLRKQMLYYHKINACIQTKTSLLLSEWYVLQRLKTNNIKFQDVRSLNQKFMTWIQENDTVLLHQKLFADRKLSSVTFFVLAVAKYINFALIQCQGDRCCQSHLALQYS